MPLRQRQVTAIHQTKSDSHPFIQTERGCNDMLDIQPFRHVERMRWPSIYPSILLSRQPDRQTDRITVIHPPNNSHMSIHPYRQTDRKTWSHISIHTSRQTERQRMTAIYPDSQIDKDSHISVMKARE